MTRFSITVEFDGRPFMGWQRQAHGPSVQQALEEAIEGITGQKVQVNGAGRTDAGVHALAMRAHFDVETRLSPFRLQEGINAKLRGAAVSVLACEEVAEDWHARFSCTGRSYVYRIRNRRAPLTYENGLVWRVVQPLDADAMDDAAQILVGLHDFSTFRSVQCQAKSPVKTLDRLDVTRNGEYIDIRADALSFLHHQVRSMVGCLALVGMGKWSAVDLADALAAKDRQALGQNAPPDGLYFIGARYDPRENLPPKGYDLPE